VQEREGEQVILISQILADEVNSGYRGMADVRVVSVDGEKVVHLPHLHGLLRAAIARANGSGSGSGEGEGEGEGGDSVFVRIKLEDDRELVLDAREADAATERVMGRCRISHVTSLDMRHLQDE